MGTAPWWRVCGVAAVGAALPTVVWRVLVGLGPTLGSPAAWRAREQLPGAGTTYVIGLSTVQLAAALLTLVLVVPGGDRIPFTRGRRWPVGLVAAASVAGALVLLVLCVLSALAWSRVDPFAGAPPSGWAILCHACYLVAPAWPLLLLATTAGYVAARASARVGR